MPVLRVPLKPSVHGRDWPAGRPGAARWAAAASLGLGLAVAAPALAQPAGPVPATSSPVSAPVSDARAWLQRVNDAARLRSYEGTLVSSDARSMMVWRVAHYADGGQQAERIDALGGEPLTVLRYNDVVHKVWLRTRVAEVEQRDARARFPALPAAGSEQQVFEWYEWQPKGAARVAGHEAEVVLLKARDAARFSQRLWAERGSGLLLRVDILGPGEQLLEWAAFSDILIGVRPRMHAVTDQLRRLDGYRVLRPAVLPTSLDNEGWQLQAPPPGFRPVQCAKRSLDPAGAAGAPVVLQAIYSDGLTHVSLFIEPFDAKRHQAEVAGSIGATHTYMARRDDQWVTVMGDVPMETLKRFASALQKKR
ncbi:MucB/RseB C-terminal domain-containing protein [Ideonella sp.]|uniref:MucB/RseB C-terminal domain-containing protein n=1 Tax=Ideonella sp. TaxID=1929293 RepID=UPI0035B0A696